MLKPKDLITYNRMDGLDSTLNSEINKAESEKLAASIKIDLINKLKNEKSFPVFNGGRMKIYTPTCNYGNTKYDFVIAPGAMIVAKWLESKGYKTDVRWEGVDKKLSGWKYSRALIEFWVGEGK